MSTAQATCKKRPTNQFRTVSLSFLSPTDLHIYLVAGMFELDLQSSSLRLGLGDHLLACIQLLLESQPSTAAVLKVQGHLNELWQWDKEWQGIFSACMHFNFKFSSHNQYLRGSMLSLRTSACARRLSKMLWRLITAVSMSSCTAEKHFKCVQCNIS